MTFQVPLGVARVVYTRSPTRTFTSAPGNAQRVSPGQSIAPSETCGRICPGTGVMMTGARWGICIRRGFCSTRMRLNGVSARLEKARKVLVETRALRHRRRLEEQQEVPAGTEVAEEGVEARQTSRLKGRQRPDLFAPTSPSTSRPVSSNT